MVGAAGFEPATLCPKPDALPGCATPDCSTNTADKIKFKGYIGYKFIIYLIFNAIRDHMIIECPNCDKNSTLI